MKTQVICLDSPGVFDAYSVLYNMENIVRQPGLLGVELRGLSKGILLELQHSSVSWKHRKSDQNTLMLTGPVTAVKKSAETIREKFPGIGNIILKYIDNYSGYDNKHYEIKGKRFSFEQCYVMGILNVTPDSFSDGGKYFDKKAAVDHAVEMINDGADIIDVGGESTRPGSMPVSEQDEIDRVIPVIKEILKHKKDVIISIDTTKSKVAAEALSSGAGIVNDISGLTFDKEMAETAAKYDAALIIMHIKGTPRDMQKNPEYQDLIPEIYDYLYEQTETARTAGVKNIIVDPGIGFGKKIEHNFELLRRLKDFKSLGYPILIGVSRKSFIGNYLSLVPEERDSASSLADMFALMNGARIIRTHNVKNGILVKKLYNRLSSNV